MAKSSANNHQPQTKPYIQEPNFNPIRHFIDTLLKCNNLEQIRQVHAHITIYGLYHNLIVVNKLLYLYTYSKSLKDAHALFGVMKERDAVTWTVMIGGFAKSCLTMRYESLILQDIVSSSNRSLQLSQKE
ncbi:putative pentatricopeptide repeat-containing protein At5g47460 [Impatiens glandulifera]|uniref:putative pentatricopeptide repeat-containing protein At5g47460 n=1 Tax=Impatiens glandulifera TaxID=253017 RepID=UPI001FB11394|nr:putative pentatricopeptide repeat-containing protein At5g47460 [Impatiens glandulifera]